VKGDGIAAGVNGNAEGGLDAGDGCWRSIDVGGLGPRRGGRRSGAHTGYYGQCHDDHGCYSERHAAGELPDAQVSRVIHLIPPILLDSLINAKGFTGLHRSNKHPPQESQGT